MKTSYVYAWLDGLITNELNPELKNLADITEDQVEAMRQQLAAEEPAMQSRLKAIVFKQNTEIEAVALVRKHYDALFGMISKAYDLLQHLEFRDMPVRGLLQVVLSRLQYLHSSFEQEFRLFINDGYPMPLHLLLALRNEILMREMELKNNLAGGIMGTGPVHVVMEVFRNFSEKIEAREVVSMREAGYIRNLFHDFLGVDGELNSITGYPALDELLILWNLNSKTCIQYFIQGFEYKAGRFKQAGERLAFLRKELKQLQIVPERRGYSLDSDFPTVKTYLGKWLNNEIRYLESRDAGFGPVVLEQAGMVMKENASKVVVAASVDQMGILIRAAYDLRYLDGRSMSMVFRAIMPYLSTPYTENPNWNRARSASYAAEESDKAAVTGMLENLIKRIQDY